MLRDAQPALIVVETYLFRFPIPRVTGCFRPAAPSLISYRKFQATGIGRRIRLDFSIKAGKADFAGVGQTRADKRVLRRTNVAASSRSSELKDTKPQP
jgi:hypothetical protein